MTAGRRKAVFREPMKIWRQGTCEKHEECQEQISVISKKKQTVSEMRIRRDKNRGEINSETMKDRFEKKNEEKLKTSGTWHMMKAVVCQNDERSNQKIQRMMREAKGGSKKEKIEEEEKRDIEGVLRVIKREVI
jgi:hypothetical protein